MGKEVKQRDGQIRQSIAAERLAGLIRDAKGKADSKLIEGRDYFDANHLLGAPEDKTGKLLLDFIQQTAK